MIEILKFELRKLVRMKSLYVCMALILFSTFFSTLFTRLLDDLASYEGFELSSMWDGVLSAASSAKIPLAVFVSFYTVYDIGGDTVKNIISRGYSRTYVFLAQLIAVVSVSVVFFALTELSSTLFGVMLLKADTPDKHLCGSIFLQLAVVIGYGGFYFGLASLFKNVGGAVSTTISVDVAVAPLVFLVGGAIIKASFEETTFNLTDYWLGNMLSDAMTLGLTNKIIATALIGSAAYFIIFVAIGYLIARRREV